MREALAYAVSQASSADTIEISGTLSEGAAVSLGQDVTLAANPDGSSATIEGNGDSDGLLTIVGGQAVTIRGLTLTDGQNSGSGGGAISNETGDLTVIDSTLTQNTAHGNGGAIDNGETAGGGSVTIIDSTLSGNTAFDDGGAIDNADSGDAGSLTVTDSSFSGNSAFNDGGAIDNNDNGGFQGSVTIADSTLANDSAANDGNEIDTNDDGGFDSSPVYVAGDVFAGSCGSTTAGGAAMDGCGLQCGYRQPRASVDPLSQATRSDQPPVTSRRSPGTAGRPRRCCWSRGAPRLR